MCSEKFLIAVISLNFVYLFTSAVPVEPQGYALVPVREVENAGPRQGIIAGWIQNSQFFPIEINVPEVISNVSSGVQQLGQNVGQGIQSAGQNVGQGFQTWISNLGQRFPIINRVPFIGSQNTQSQKPQRIFVLLPPKDGDQVDSIPDPSELFTYP